MKELIAMLCLVLATSSPFAFAQEQGKGRVDNAVKAEKRVKTRKPPTEKQLAHQQRMKDCSRKAAGQKLKGNDRKQFMKTCLKG
jgi:hypothetical protein